MLKRYTVTGAEQFKNEQIFPTMLWNFDMRGEDSMQVSDGSHTFEELYEHRYALWISTCQAISLLGYYRSKIDEPDEPPTLPVWRSKLHDDGSEYEGYFLLGMGKEKGKMLTYHLPMSKWEETNFAQTLDNAPEWDGHTSADVLERLKLL